MDKAAIFKRLAPIARHFDPSALDYLEEVAALTTPLYLKAGERFPKTGYENHQSAYISEGVIRLFFVDKDGKETTVRFLAEGDFAIYLEGLQAKDSTVTFYWEAASDTLVLAWGNDALAKLNQNIPGWHFLTIKVLKSMLLQISVERAEMFNDDATTRYLKFSARYPHIIKRVQLRDVANFLGIAPQSLSRIRHQLQNK